MKIDAQDAGKALIMLGIALGAGIFPNMASQSGVNAGYNSLEARLTNMQRSLAKIEKDIDRLEGFHFTRGK